MAHHITARLVAPEGLLPQKKKVQEKSRRPRYQRQRGAFPPEKGPEDWQEKQGQGPEKGLLKVKGMQPAGISGGKSRRAAAGKLHSSHSFRWKTGMSKGLQSAGFMLERKGSRNTGFFLSISKTVWL